MRPARLCRGERPAHLTDPLCAWPAPARPTHAMSSASAMHVHDASKPRSTLVPVVEEDEEDEEDEDEEDEDDEELYLQQAQLIAAELAQEYLAQRLPTSA